jgi:hypothetical protein
MLYGNASAISQSTIDATYIFHDEFDGTSIDTDLWQVNTHHANSTVTVVGGRAILHDYNNTSVEIITKQKYPYGYLKAGLRREPGASADDFDSRYGYNAIKTGVSPRGSVRIDGYSGEQPHSLYSYWGGNDIGTKLLTTGFNEWAMIFSDGFQQSTFRGETLETTASGIDSKNYILFSINNSSTKADLEIDYVRLKAWPFIYTTTSDELVLWDLIKPTTKLHVKYTPAANWSESDYIYESLYGDPMVFNDIYITEGTSNYNNDNTIFLATDHGVYVIEERQADEENSRKKYFLV